MPKYLYYSEMTDTFYFIDKEAGYKTDVTEDLREVIGAAYKMGKEEAIADLFKALPDCDSIEIEHLITIMEQIKGEKNESAT